MFCMIQRGIVIAACIHLVICSSARAQPTFSAMESIDWMVSDSPLIVRGTIGRVEYEPYAGSERYVWATVRLNVLETLKGQHSQALTVMLRRPAGNEELDSLVDGKWTTRPIELSHEFIVRQAAWESLQHVEQASRR